MSFAINGTAENGADLHNYLINGATTDRVVVQSRDSGDFAAIIPEIAAGVYATAGNYFTFTSTNTANQSGSAAAGEDVYMYIVKGAVAQDGSQVQQVQLVLQARQVQQVRLVLQDSDMNLSRATRMQLPLPVLVKWSWTHQPMALDLSRFIPPMLMVTI